MNERLVIGYCGVCCSHCGIRKCIPRMAEELKRFIQAYKYGDWIEHVTKEFKYENFMKGLNWFANSSCPGCLEEGGMSNCEVRNCCKRSDLKNCYFCEYFQDCEKLRYQKDTYDIDDNYARIKQISYENWLNEQEEKLRANFDNIWFLEKKASKRKYLNC